MTSPAPVTGRTADEMREEIADLIRRHVFGSLESPRLIAEGIGNATDAILAGPVARLRADLRESAMEHIARDLADEQTADEIAHLLTENTNLRDRVREAEEAAEGMIPTPKMIAAAWAVVRDRWPGQPHLLGPGPAFREAIQAALAAKAAPLPESDTGGKA